jgi:hypothetical protein
MWEGCHVGGASRGEFLGIVQIVNNRTALFLCSAKLTQSHRTSLCSLRYTVHPEHNRRETRLPRDLRVAD